MKRIILLLVILIFASNIDAEGVRIKTGFITGNAYLSFTDKNRETYAMGVIDGMFLAPFFGALKAGIKRFESCIEGMTGSQVVAIINKYLYENPQRWHESMNVIAY